MRVEFRLTHRIRTWLPEIHINKIIFGVVSLKNPSVIVQVPVAIAQVDADTMACTLGIVFIVRPPQIIIEV